MTFASKFKLLINELGLSQKKVSEVTGICPSAISQYLHGEHEPSKERQKQIATALGVQENYFHELLPETEIDQSAVKITVAYAAKLMRKSEEFVKEGLRQGTCPFGYAVKMKQWEFYIFPKVFSDLMGIDLNGVSKTKGDFDV